MMTKSLLPGILTDFRILTTVHLIEIIGVGILILRLSLGKNGQQLLVFQRLIDSEERFLAPHVDGERKVGEDDRVPDCKNRKLKVRREAGAVLSRRVRHEDLKVRLAVSREETEGGLRKPNVPIPHGKHSDGQNDDFVHYGRVLPPQDPERTPTRHHRASH